MKFVLASVLVACGLLAVSARRLNLVKRQADPCNIAESAVPEECRSLLDYDSLEEALFPTDNFLGLYCNEACGRPLFDFFRGCDEATGSKNSTEFDFYCSRNQAGDSCAESVFNDLTFAFACFGEGFGGGQCADQCRDNLTVAYNEIGCCAFSYFAVFAGESGASAIFSLCTDVPQTLCIGGASGETLSFPTSFVAVDPLCEDLVKDVDSECLRYLGLDPFTSHNTFCNTECGEEIYDFQLQCDERLGTQTATIIDLLCARNGTGSLCGNVLFTLFTDDTFLSCDNFDGLNCSAQCRDSLIYFRNQGGCCTDTIFAVESGPLAVNQLYSRCGLEASEICVGAFSDEPILPRPDGDDDCRDLQQSVPDVCLEYTSFDFIFIQASRNPEQFYEDFCNGGCSEVIYEYFLECDVFTFSDDNAAYVDFLCSKNSEGIPCVGIISNSSLFDEIDSACPDIVSVWGCCLFTLHALGNNVTYVEDIVDECGLGSDESILCIGGISGEPVAADEGDNRDSDCKELRNDLADECVTYLLKLGNLLFTNPGRVISEFCDSDCAEPVHEYVAECEDGEFASYIDLACTKDRGGAECGRVYTDANVNSVIEGVCADASDEQCSSQCGDALQRLDDTWGCCLFTFSALISNATFASDLWSECGVDAPDLCEGGLSGERIDVPGGDDRGGGGGGEENDESQNSSRETTAITSAVLMFAALFASLSF